MITVVDLSGFVKLMAIVVAVATSVSAMFVACMNCKFVTTKAHQNFKAEIARKLDMICAMIKDKAEWNREIAYFMGEVKRYMEDHCDNGKGGRSA